MIMAICHHLSSSSTSAQCGSRATSDLLMQLRNNVWLHVISSTSILGQALKIPADRMQPNVVENVCMSNTLVAGDHKCIQTSVIQHVAAIPRSPAEL